LHLIFIEIPSCCFHQQPTSSNQDVVSLNGQIKESQGAMTEATAIRQKEKKENTVAIQDNGGSTKQSWGQRLVTDFLKETCPLKIVVLFFWAKN